MKSLYFLSDAGGVADIWKVGISFSSEKLEIISDPQALTVGIGMRRFSLTADTRILVYSMGGVATSVGYKYKGGGVGATLLMQIDPDQVFGFSTAKRFDFDGQSDPEFSPDGKWIAFESERSGKNEIWRTTIDGNELVQVTDDERTNTGPSWSPDGRWLAYDSGGGNNAEIRIIPVEGGEPGFVLGQQDTTVIAYDNGAEEGIALAVPGGQLAVRFTPETYPVTVIAIRVQWTNGSHAHATDVQYAVWTDAAGANAGPVTQVVANTAHTVSNRPGFEEMDVSSHNIVIESGDFYCSIIQPSTVPLGIGFDEDGQKASRSWISEDGGVTWFNLDGVPFSFPFNIVIRAIVVSDQVTSVADKRTLIPSDYSLEQNYPNPFNPETRIEFQLPEASHVVVRIFNPLGQEIRTLVDVQYEAGFHGVRWDGKDNDGRPVSSGVYLYQLQAGDFSQVKKMSLLR